MTTAELPDEAENPCLSRFRHRRLLAFLSRERYDIAFNGLMIQASALLNLEHLKYLVRQGLWEDAMDYLDGFLPVGPRSLHAHVFRNFLLMHHYMASIAAGDKAAVDKLLAHHWLRHVVYAKQTNQAIPPVMAHTLLWSEQFRACMSWDEVRRAVQYILDRLVSRTPELNRPLTLPTRYTKPHQVLPIDVGLGLCRRRRVKEQRPQLRSAAVAKAILFRRSQRYLGPLADSSFVHIEDAKEWLVTIIDDSLRAGLGGRYSFSYQAAKEASLLQQAAKEGAPVASLCRTLNLTTHARRSGISSVTTPGAPVFPFCQTRKLTIHVERSGIPSVTTPGTEESQEGACEGFNPRKNPRAELRNTDEYLDSKRQRTTGTFGEASMGPVNEVWAEAHQLAGETEHLCS